jgi:hypothetical protein
VAGWLVRRWLAALAGAVCALSGAKPRVKATRASGTVGHQAKATGVREIVHDFNLSANPKRRNGSAWVICATLGHLALYAIAPGMAHAQDVPSQDKATPRR